MLEMKFSDYIVVELSEARTVVSILTMESSLLVMVKMKSEQNIGSSRTHGQQHGVKTVMLDS
jgi:hypothetical protein